jgi:hypothetical protein
VGSYEILHFRDILALRKLPGSNCGAGCLVSTILRRGITLDAIGKCDRHDSNQSCIPDGYFLEVY